jgi:hypothetical protein
MPKNVKKPKSLHPDGYLYNEEYYAYLETVEKNVKNLLTKSCRQKNGSKLEFVLFYFTNLQMFLANNFF